MELALLGLRAGSIEYQGMSWSVREAITATSFLFM